MADEFVVDVTHEAEHDAQEVYDYLAAEEANLPAAERWADRLQARFDSLKQFPWRCARIPEATLLGVNWRHALLGPYRIIFEVRGRRVVVLRIIHGARLLAPEEDDPAD